MRHLSSRTAIDLLSLIIVEGPTQNGDWDAILVEAKRILGEDSTQGRSDALRKAARAVISKANAIRRESLRHAAREKHFVSIQDFIETEREYPTCPIFPGGFPRLYVEEETRVREFGAFQYSGEEYIAVRRRMAGQDLPRLAPEFPDPAQFQPGDVSEFLAKSRIVAVHRNMMATCVLPAYLVVWIPADKDPVLVGSFRNEPFSVLKTIKRWWGAAPKLPVADRTEFAILAYLVNDFRDELRGTPTPHIREGEHPTWEARCTQLQALARRAQMTGARPTAIRNATRLASTLRKAMRKPQ